MSILRGLPTSRAYWELKAEQMMNRIFDPDALIDLDPAPSAQGTGAANASSAVVSPPPQPVSTVVAPTPRRRLDDQILLWLGILGTVGLISAIASVLYLRHWSQVQQTINQERNLLLVERLRSLGPAQPAPAPTTPSLGVPGREGAGTRIGDDLPPPPEEPWMEQLSALPSPTTAPSRAERPATVLSVPVSPRLAPAARTASPPSPEVAAAPLPQLVGVVASQGRAGSAIFQVNGSTTSVGVGEAISSTGWQLRSTDGDSAVIERAGDVRRLSLTSGS